MMLKLRGFEADAEVLGNVCAVRFRDGALTIEGLTLASAQDALAALATGKVRTADDSRLPVEPASCVEERAADEQAAKTEPDGAPGAQRRRGRRASASDRGEADQRQRTLPGILPPTPADLAAELADPRKAALANADPCGSKRAEVDDSSPSRPSATADPFRILTPSGEVPEELRGAHRIRDVLSYLAAKGVREESDFLAECERIKHAVPVLGRIANLAERVQRTLGVMGEDG